MAVAFRTGTNQWTQSIAVTMGNQATAGNPVSDRGFVVGLNPALVQNILILFHSKFSQELENLRIGILIT